jgi:hypothetical protein
MKSERLTLIAGFGLLVPALFWLLSKNDPTIKALAPHSAEAFAFTFALSDLASLLTAIKSSAVYSNQTFQPTTQLMVTLLSIALKRKGIAVRTSSMPGGLDTGGPVIESAQSSGKISMSESKDN